MKPFSKIEIGKGVIDQEIPFFTSLASQFAIISDKQVASLYGEAMVQFFKKFSAKVALFDFPPGEIYKTRQTKEDLENQLFERGFDRESCIIGFGGGVVTDIAGYLASTFCRGVPYVAIPTTLMGMVDASLGGKTGVNLPYGKNLVGSIYHAEKIFIDPSYLKTLPQKEMANGCAEMIKHGLIADPNYFLFLEERADEILSLTPSIVDKAIAESCRIKTTIVNEDLREHSKRRLLNFGHTIGHALEAVSDYSLSHGEAIAIGMLVESDISSQLGFLAEEDCIRLKNLLKRFGLPLKLPEPYSPEKMMQAMAFDKKTTGSMPRCVTLQSIGSPMDHSGKFCTPIPEKVFFQALRRMNDLYTR